ncbi:MAG: T9SS type A sorting domain-containing protein, partial [Chlorobi bacterium]|nr:T9SS type A sorting domain-containing protein [Chlorobiota bacterium]
FSFYDILGKEVMRENEGFKSNGQYILEQDMSELKPGIYYLSVSLDGNPAYSSKIVKR